MSEEKEIKEVDMFFHSYKEDGSLEWQGKVMMRLKNSNYILIQTYNWVDGSKYCKYLVDLETIVKNKWKFFDTGEEMNNFIEKDKE